MWIVLGLMPVVRKPYKKMASTEGGEASVVNQDLAIPVERSK